MRISYLPVKPSSCPHDLPAVTILHIPGAGVTVTTSAAFAASSPKLAMQMNASSVTPREHSHASPGSW